MLFQKEAVLLSATSLALAVATDWLGLSWSLGVEQRRAGITLTS